MLCVEVEVSSTSGPVFLPTRVTLGIGAWGGVFLGQKQLPSSHWEVPCGLKTQGFSLYLFFWFILLSTIDLYISKTIKLINLLETAFYSHQVTWDCLSVAPDGQDLAWEKESHPWTNRITVWRTMQLNWTDFPICTTWLRPQHWQWYGVSGQFSSGLCMFEGNSKKTYQYIEVKWYLTITPIITHWITAVPLWYLTDVHSYKPRCTIKPSYNHCCFCYAVGHRIKKLQMLEGFEGMTRSQLLEIV